MKKTTENLKLPCTLTNEEKLRYSKNLVDYMDQKAQTVKELKDKTQQFKSRITELDSDINQLQRKISSGIEYRDIPCEIIYDYTLKEKITIRQDTGEIVKSVKMTDEDLQEELSLEFHQV